ncbi:MAG: SHOCT domain-containing protein [Negativicutes bacterium]|nr:SHOCT domain-containing protein [Negativicutes bacterium]
MMGYWGYSGPFHWLGFGFGMISHVVFLILAICGVFWFFKAISRSRQHQESTALEILKSRYAKGEISSEDYQRIKKEIE